MLTPDDGAPRWELPAAERRRPRMSRPVVAVAVVLTALAHLAFAIDLHNVVTTPVSCDVYCSTVPVVELPALIAWPVLDLACGVLAVVVLTRGRGRVVLGWVVLATFPMQVAAAALVAALLG